MMIDRTKKGVNQMTELLNKINALTPGERLNLIQVMDETAKDMGDVPFEAVAQAAYDEITHVEG